MMLWERYEKQYRNLGNYILVPYIINVWIALLILGEEAAVGKQIA